MARQEGGWPLGLQPLNARVGLRSQFDSYESISFSSHVSGSPNSSTDSSTDLDLKSTGTSVFRERRGVTLGSLLGLSGFLVGPSRRWRQEPALNTKTRKHRRRDCNFFFFLTLCNTTTAGDLDGESSGPSLGQFLELERRAANDRHCAPMLTYEIDGLPPVATVSELDQRNSLFGADGRVVPPLPQSPKAVGVGPLLCPCLGASG